MTATGHALVGAAIGSQITNPILGLPLSFLSHFVFDKLPHWDTMTNRKEKTSEQIIKETIVDVLLGYFLVALIFIFTLHVNSPAYVLLNAFVAQLPDWLEAPYSVLKFKLPFFYENYKIQSYVHHLWFDSRLKAPWGIVTQLVVVTIFLLWALQK
ncbi:MAG: hypothetical protein UY21_C0009G0051 [Microgenomates group bacterium GW2011_GWA1_48_10]|nr:MAG: hypothetical protein UY21_C0009G0051 [Microgenomates group bacterium GW2011_GWA1_48_10]